MRSRVFWLRQLHRWHWISAAICLSGMLLFAATGMTLNHAAWIKAEPTVMERRASLPESLRNRLTADASPNNAPLPSEIAEWIDQNLPVQIGSRAAEWSDDEVYVALPRPGGDAWLSIERKTGAVMYERTNRGAISYLNDLHKGRNTGVVWMAFLDLFAASCIVFSVTGFFLLKFNSAARPATWPMVGLGVIVPVLLALFFIH